MQPVSITENGFTVTTEPSRMDLPALHDFLCNHSHWSRNIPIEKVKRSNEHSLCFSLLEGDKQVGFARVISDFATIAYLGDVYILPEYRGRGLSKLLMKAVISHPELQGLRKWILTTKDAHGLYEKFGFAPVAQPERYMELVDKNVYSDNR